MTAFLAGMTHTRCAEHPKAGDITGAMRGVLTVMSYPARDARSECPEAERFICKLSWASIAKLSGYDRDYLRHDLAPAMVALDLIERVGELQPRKAVHWRLRIHADAERERLGVSDPQSTGEGWGAQTPSLGCSDPQPGGVGPPNPSKSPGGPPEGDDDDRRAADAPPSADAAGVAAAASTGDPSTDGPGGPVGYVMSELGYTQTRAEEYIERKRAAQEASDGRPVVRLFGFIKTCVERDLEERTSRPSRSTTSSSGKGKASRPGSAGARANAAKGPRHKPTDEEMAQAIWDLRDDVPADEVAARFGLTAQTVKGWRRTADDARRNIIRQADEGKDPERIITGWKVPRAEIRRALAEEGREYSPEEREVRRLRFGREWAAEQFSCGSSVDLVVRQLPGRCGVLKDEAQRIVAELGHGAAGGAEAPPGSGGSRPRALVDSVADRLRDGEAPEAVTRWLMSSQALSLDMARQAVASAQRRIASAAAS